MLLCPCRLRLLQHNNKEKEADKCLGCVISHREVCGWKEMTQVIHAVLMVSANLALYLPMHFVPLHLRVTGNIRGDINRKKQITDKRWEETHCDCSFSSLTLSLMKIKVMEKKHSFALMMWYKFFSLFLLNVAAACSYLWLFNDIEMISVDGRISCFDQWESDWNEVNQ